MYTMYIVQHEIIWTLERLEHDLFIPKDIWRIFDSKALVDLFQR
jgi:hypothetical protein